MPCDEYNIEFVMAVGNYLNYLSSDPSQFNIFLTFLGKMI